MNWLERKILKEETMKWLKAHWPAITALLGSALPFLIPSLQAYIAANPKSTVAVLFSAVIAAYYANSPKQQNAAKQ